ncbi:hypothetical protein [Amycolatopsis sp. DG1A-15b]|uniref:hypothetical protein n=1 Tax=Amycolatopsis sp. DG1A-15b TaxID=3052846 RepID=UPI00255BEC3E|nr:hypothetical protein [Amycolatopsis sp. DG1A-15b]WIX85112.1 hypothetical protein QRY02_28205 [Amycolatopsis sp. DG1A-15b]
MTIMGTMMPELRTAFPGVSNVLVTALAGSRSTRKVQESYSVAAEPLEELELPQPE